MSKNSGFMVLSRSLVSHTMKRIYGSCSEAVHPRMTHSFRDMHGAIVRIYEQKLVTGFWGLSKKS